MLNEKIKSSLSVLVFPLTMCSALAFTILGFDYFEWNHSLVAGIAVLVFGFLLL